MPSLGEWSKFAHFGRKRIVSDAFLFVRAGFPLVSDFEIGRRGSSFPYVRFKQKSRCASMGISLINDIFAHYEDGNLAARAILSGVRLTRGGYS